MLVQCSSCRKLFSANDESCSCGASVTTSLAYDDPATDAIKSAKTQPNAPATTQDLHSAALTAQSAAGEPILFPTSTPKFVVMYFATFSLYHYFWAFKNWQYLKTHRNVHCIPLVRTCFFIVWCYGMMKDVQAIAKETNPTFQMSDRIGLYYPLCFMIGWLFSFTLIAFPNSPGNAVAWLAVMSPVIPLAHATSYICLINKDAGKQSLVNSRFTVWNYLAIVVGAAIWLRYLFLMVRGVS